MLTGIHILLTLKCTSECDHCFLHCGPRREATFTIGQLRTLIRQIEELGTVNIVYFEGGEPFLFYPLLLEGLRMVRAAGFDAGIVTNGYWATSVEDGLHWLRPIRDLGVVDLSVSDDEFHRLDKNDRRAEFARQAAQQLGIPTATICIEPPSVSPQAPGRCSSSARWTRSARKRMRSSLEPVHYGVSLWPFKPISEDLDLIHFAVVESDHPAVAILEVKPTFP